MTYKPTIGIIGLGKMGLEIGKRLVDTGYEVIGYDTGKNAQMNGRLAGIPAYPIEKISGHAETAILSLPDKSEIVSETVEKLAANGIRIKNIIDTGNSDYRNSQRLAESLRKEKGIDFIDAGISGGPGRVQDGAACAMAGGDEEAYKETLPILSAFCANSHYMGPSGSGHMTKMIHNATDEKAKMHAIGEAVAVSYSAGIRKFEWFSRQKAKSILSSDLGEADLWYFSPSDIEAASAEPKVEGRTFSWALDVAEAEGIAVPLTDISYGLRDYSTGNMKADDIRKRVEKQLEKISDLEYFQFSSAIRTGALKSDLMRIGNDIFSPPKRALYEAMVMISGESLYFARKLGLDPEKAAAALNDGLCRSKVFDVYLGKVRSWDVYNTLPGYFERYSDFIGMASDTDTPVPTLALSAALIVKNGDRKEYRHALKVLEEQLDMLDQIKAKGKRAESFAIQNVMRNKFGGHSIYRTAEEKKEVSA